MDHFGDALSSKNKLDKSKMLKKILSVWYEAKSISYSEKKTK